MTWYADFSLWRRFWVSLSSFHPRCKGSKPRRRHGDHAAADPTKKGRPAGRTGGFPILLARVWTYQPVKGDSYFALQLKRSLTRPERDAEKGSGYPHYDVHGGTQAGPGWIAAHQIAEAVMDAAGQFDEFLCGPSMSRSSPKTSVRILAPQGPQRK